MTGPRVAILTAIMDGYDTLKPTLPQAGAEVDWVCLTDSKELAAQAEETPIELDGLRAGRLAMVHPTGWEIIFYDRPADEHPNRAAKRPKMHPAMFTDAPHSVWLDASFQVVSPTFAANMVMAADNAPNGIAQFTHPWRQCLFAEASESMNLPKYTGEKDAIARQVEAYSLAGMPYGWGLWATGVIARRHSRRVLNWGQTWAEQIQTFSYQDQISHPFVCWKTGVRPAALPGNHLGNRWLSYQGSGRH